MGTVSFRRPTRQPAPELPDGELALESPPENPPPPQRAWGQSLMMLPMLAGSAATMLMFAGNRGGSLQYVTGALFGVSMLGMVGTSVMNGGGTPSKREMIKARREFLRQLSTVRRTARRTAERQRTAMCYRHPDPDTLWSIAAGGRLWERRPSDGDFGVIRISVGQQGLATPLIPPESRPVDELEPMCAAALRRFVVSHALLPDLPIAATLRGFARIHLTGDPDRARALARAMLAQFATFHPPDDALVLVCRSHDRAAHWEWARWLPHAQHPTETDALGPVRLIGGSLPALESHVEELVRQRPRFNPRAVPVEGRHLVVVLDGGDTVGSDHLMTDGGVDGVTILDLEGRPPRTLDATTLVLDVDAAGALSTRTVHGTDEIGTADGLSVGAAEGLARQLAPLRLSGAAVKEDQPLATDQDLAELLRLGDPYAFDPVRAWSVPRPNRDRLRVTIGMSPEGLPVDLDIKESAQDGMGPHGLLIGATGSGKSEYLRTLVLALAATHSSEILNFVLVDFKGGATFTRLDTLPHTSAVITNLEGELALVDRMQDAINGETIRRQELLRAAGNFASQRDYERARAAGKPLDPLPALLIVCDEFSELLTAKPDFIDMFVQIGRVGRSLGIHLLLASQRLEEGRLRGLDTHLSYRIGLRTFSAMESRAVLGVPDAFELPRSPGHGYMKFGTEPLVRFKAAYVSGRYRRDGAERGPDPGADRLPVREFTAEYVPPPRPAEAPAPPPEDSDDEVLGDSLLDVLVDRMRGQGPPAHQVWLPPLDDPTTLDRLLPLAVSPDRGLVAGRPDLRALVGEVDKPFEQRREPLWLNLSGAAGNAIVVGAAQSGKSTLLRSLVCSLALTHTAAEAQFYCLDFGGGGLLGLRGLPHVGGACTRHDVDQVRRTVAEVAGVLDERERRFAELAIDSMASYRRRRAAGEFADDPFGDVFLVVDDWAVLRADFDAQADTVADLAARGLGYGIHVVATAGRWMDVPYRVRDRFTSRLELRLGDPGDSELGRRIAVNVPEGRPGRGLTADSLHFLSALPRIDGRPTADDLGDGVADLVRRVRDAWRGPTAPPVRLLPTMLEHDRLPAPDPSRPHLIPVGVAEDTLAPVLLDVAAEPHLVVFSDVEGGKSSFLRALAHRVAAHYAPGRAKIIPVDVRRSLLGAVPASHLFHYCGSRAATAEAMADVAQGFARRLPPPDITPEQLRTRQWWTGPEIFILVDDYDLITGGSENPLLPLLDYVSQARDVGLHLVIARRTGGAARSLYDPIIGRLRELSAPAFIGSGPRDEGPLFGDVRPSAQPPGRGWLATRRDGARLVQLGYRPE